MRVEQMIMNLLRFKPEGEVKVRVGVEQMGPAHYTVEVDRNGLGDAVIVCTHKVDDPEDVYDMDEPATDS